MLCSNSCLLLTASSRIAEPVRVAIDVADDAAVQWAVTGLHCALVAVYLLELASSRAMLLKQHLLRARC